MLSFPSIVIAEQDFPSFKPFYSLTQKTLKKTITCEGIGVHSGQKVTMTLYPASSNTGFVFIRTDIKRPQNKIAGRYDRVTDTSLCTKIANREGVSVATIEHLVAALAGCGINNTIIEINGPEVPIMDGSSEVFVDLIHKAGTQSLKKGLKVIKVLKPIEVRNAYSYVRFIPADEFGLSIQFNANGRLNNQHWALSFYPKQEDFSTLISAARTFGFLEDAEKLWAAGFAKGSSLENTVVIDKGEVLNKEGLRYKDEFVRHKLLDAIGDLALANVYICGHFEGLNPSHTLNNQLLRTLLSDQAIFNEPLPLSRPTLKQSLKKTRNI